MNKRIAAVLLSAVICMGSLTACGMGGEVSSAVSGTESGSASSALTPKAESEVADSLDGLAEFMLTNGYVSGEKAEMKGDFIGAKETGYKYLFSAAGGTSNVRVELYEYDPENLNDTAKAVLESVKANGSFDLIGQTVTGAYISNSGKYLMLYVDTSLNDGAAENIELRDKAVKAFQEFKA